MRLEAHTTHDLPCYDVRKKCNKYDFQVYQFRIHLKKEEIAPFKTNNKGKVQNIFLHTQQEPRVSIAFSIFYSNHFKYSA